MIHYPSLDTIMQHRMYNNYNKWKRLHREKMQHKQNCYKAQKIKLQIMDML